MLETAKRYIPAVTAVVAVAALVLATVTWVRLEQTRRDLDDATTALEGLAVQAALVQNAVGGISGDALTDVIAELDGFATSTIDVPVDIDQQLPINTEIAFTRTIEVPIVATVPIREDLNTTISVQGPFGVDIPIDVEVPIDVDVPIDLIVPITVDETIRVDTDIPIKLDIPISLEVEGTPLADLAVALRDALADLQGAFG